MVQEEVVLTQRQAVHGWGGCPEARAAKALQNHSCPEVTKRRAEPPGHTVGNELVTSRPSCLAWARGGSKGLLSRALLQTHCTEVKQPNYLIVCTQH